MVFRDDLFKNKSFLITGASSGIGADAALTLNALGAKVVAIARDEQKLQNQKKQAKNPDKFICISKDLSVYKDLDLWTLNLCKELGEFDGAVLSAGISTDSSIRTPNYIQQAEQIFNINYFGNLQVLKGMVDRRAHCKEGSSFVWIASIAASITPRGMGLYAGSKAAVIATAKSISKEVIPNFRINTISPAAIHTPMVETSNKIRGKDLQVINNQIPLGLGKVKDTSSLICFLLSEGSSWITGQDFILDGGRIG